MSSSYTAPPSYLAPSTGNLSSLMASLNKDAANSILLFTSGATSALWTLMDEAIRAWLTSNSPYAPGLRVLITLSDGTVCYDSKSSTNTYADFETKTINENHNSRVAILQALLGNSGIGLEAKLSTSTRQSSNYLAQRIYFSPEYSLGVIRVSIDASYSNRPS